MRYARALPWVAALALAMLAAGCTNPFRPATPEPADPNGVIQDFSSPSKLLQTLADAIANKGKAGSEAWASAMAGAIADSTSPSQHVFYAFADQRVVDAWPNKSLLPDAWDVSLERTFYDKFITLSKDPYVLDWGTDSTSPLDDIDLTVGKAYMHRKYTIVSVATNGDATNIATGYVDFNMLKYDGRWHIVKWQDRVDPVYGPNPSDNTSYSLGRRRFDSLANI